MSKVKVTQALEASARKSLPSSVLESLSADVMNAMISNVYDFFDKLRRLVLLFNAEHKAALSSLDEKSQFVNPYLSCSIGGNFFWSEQYQNTVNELMPELEAILSPIGTIAVENGQYVFWSGELACKVAERLGQPVHKSMAISWIDTEFESVIVPEFCPGYPNFYLDNAIAFLFRTVTSAIYAQNAIGDANYFSESASINAHSIFWNFELTLLQKKGIKVHHHVLSNSAKLQIQQNNQSQLDSHQSDVRFNHILRSRDAWESKNTFMQLQVIHRSVSMSRPIQEPESDVNGLKLSMLLAYIHYWRSSAKISAEAKTPYREASATDEEQDDIKRKRSIMWKCAKHWMLFKMPKKVHDISETREESFSCQSKHPKSVN